MRVVRAVARPLPAVAALALSLAGCTGASTAAPTPTPVETTQPPSPTPTPVPVVTTAAPTPTATRPPVVPSGSESPAPLGQPTCSASAVTITDADTVTKPGYRAEVYVLRTTGAPCQLNGYPTVLVNGATVTHGGSGLPPEVPRAYTLSKATSLSFALATARPGTSCDDQTAITVTLPGTSTPRGVVTDLRVCDHQLGVTPVHRLGDDE